MTDVTSAAAATPAAASTFSGQTLSLPGWNPSQRGLAERERLIDQARGTDAARQLQRCFPRWMKAFDHLAWRALVRLAANEPVDPNDPDMWESRDEQAQAVLRRHGLTTVKAGRLTMATVNTLIDSQKAADREAGLDWGRLTVPASRLDEPLRRAHAAAADRSERPQRVRVPRGPAAGARRTARAGGGQGRRPVAVGARLPGRVRRRGPAVLADRLAHVARARRRAARHDRRRAAAGRPVRRPGAQDRGLAAQPGAVARGDPTDHRARRIRRARPVRGDTAVRPGTGAARADQRADAARRAEGVP